MASRAPLPFDDLLERFDGIPNGTVNSTGSPRQCYDPENNLVSGWIIILVLYIAVVILSLLGNSVVCFSVMCNPRMRSVTNLFLANQALSDIFMTILNIPFIAYFHMTRDWPFGEVMCHLVEFMKMTSVYVSTLMLTAIALDRHQFIMHPHRPRISKRTVVLVSSVIWAISLLLACPYSKLEVDLSSHQCDKICIVPLNAQDFWKYLTIATFVLQLLIPLTLMSVVYFRLYMMLRSRGSVGNVNARLPRTNRRASKQRTTVKLVLFVATFTLCWCPINVYLLVTNFNQSLRNSALYMCLHWFAVCSVCLNPIAFAFLNKNFRRGLQMFCCSSRNNANQTISTDFSK
ncbi:probable G-protein coupled receptor 83 [Acanthaster planci]|uniref:Probable G-protein coupled receptor 83 n=1 Tax=Acanthaster planci TaxID=133434 RepID=A0A8B7Y6J9_ACAPL|nr:probable G-protein coupled receptor 83 [Acanthaster planci]XP_022087965.1 probable G-protein coupled receptor 83 [Acanthaster planci]